MDADRKDRHDAFHRHELALQNGKGSDDEYKKAVLIELCRFAKSLLATDLVKPSDMKQFCSEQYASIKTKWSLWPKTPIELISFIILVAGLCGSLIKIFDGH